MCDRRKIRKVRKDKKAKKKTLEKGEQKAKPSSSSSSRRRLNIIEKDHEFPASCRPSKTHLSTVLHHPFSIFIFQMLFLGISCWSAVVRTIANNTSPDDTGNKALAWTFLAMEILQNIYFVLMCVIIVSPPKKRKHLYLANNTNAHQLPSASFPRLDIFLPMCKEDLTIQKRTIRSVMNLNYPHNKLRVYVLDDGESDKLRDWCNGTQKSLRRSKRSSKQHKSITNSFSNHTNNIVLRYIRRDKTPGKAHGFKAGNLNHGLRLTGTNKDAAEYFAVFDADMMPVPDFARRMLPHLLNANNDSGNNNNNKVAVVQCPQRHYNIPYGDPLAQDQPVPYDVMEPRKDSIGCAWILGTGFIAKRAAFNDIGGGFTTYGICEDMSSTCHLFKGGWTVSYVHEDLQIGLQPDSFFGHVRQRTRWCIGSIQTGVEHNWFLHKTGQMTFWQRITFLFFCSVYFTCCLMTVLSLVIPLLLLLTDQSLVCFESRADIRYQALLGAASLVAMKVSQYSYGGNIGLMRLFRETQIFPTLGPFFLLSIVRHFFLPSWLGGHRTKFKSSGRTMINRVSSTVEEQKKEEAKTTNDCERDPDKRMSFLPRLFYMLRRGLWFHALVVTLLISALVSRAALIYNNPEQLAYVLATMLKDDPTAVPTYMELFVVHVGFPPVWYVLTLQYYLGMLYYAINPPVQQVNPQSEKVSELMLEKVQQGHGEKAYVAKHSIMSIVWCELPSWIMVFYSLAVVLFVV